MNIEEFREYCLAKPETTECFPFNETILVFKVKGKMFALIDLDHPTSTSLKCDPERVIDLREEYSGIKGAYHFNKRYWNTVAFDSDVNDDLILELIDHSYSEVVKKLAKKERKELL